MRAGAGAGFDHDVEPKCLEFLDRLRGGRNARFTIGRFA
jgi:hypothetical protein